VEPVKKENKMRMFQEILEEEIELIFEINKELLTMEKLVVFGKKEAA